VTPAGCRLRDSGRPGAEGRAGHGQRLGAHPAGLEGGHFVRAPVGRIVVSSGAGGRADAGERDQPATRQVSAFRIRQVTRISLYASPSDCLRYTVAAAKDSLENKGLWLADDRSFRPI